MSEKSNDPTIADPAIRWMDTQIAAARRKRDRAAQLGMQSEFNYFDLQADELMARRARFVRDHNLDGGGDDAA